MNRIVGFLRKNFGHFVYFYHHLRYRIFITIALSFVVGILDGFGLAMFLPLLKMISGDYLPTGEELGGMSFLIDIFDYLNIQLNLINILIIIIVFFSLKGLAQFANSYYNTIIRLYFIRKLRYSNVDQFSSYEYKSFVQADAGRIQNTMSAEVGRVSQAYGAYFNTINSWILMLIYLSLAFLTNWQFAILVGIGGYISNFAYRQIYKKTKEQSSVISRGGHTFHRLLIQMVHYFKYLKATGFIENYGMKMKSSILYIENANKKIGFYNAILGATREPLIIMVVALVIFIQVNFLAATMGGILLSLMFFYRALNYVMSLQSTWNQFLNNSGALSNMTEFMKELSEHQEVYGNHTLTSFNDEITLKNVDFFYNEKQILNGINLTVKKNQTIAIVGESGSGKTTLVNLITALMPIEHGEMRVDGIQYSDLDFRSLQKRIGYITQDSVIFSDSIYNNVTNWSSKSTENVDKFWKVLEQSAILDFVKQLPKAENEELGNNGIQLSGGQKQRISIARELFKEIDILVMDEATSALDSETEKSIKTNIENLKGRYTIIIVAHRLSTIKEADVILLLSKGRVLDSGSYTELVNKSVDFRRMTELQIV